MSSKRQHKEPEASTPGGKHPPREGRQSNDRPRLLLAIVKVREVPIPHFVSGIWQRLPLAAIQLACKVAVQVRDGLALAAVRVQLIELRPHQGVIIRQSPRAAA